MWRDGISILILRRDLSSALLSPHVPWASLGNLTAEQQPLAAHPVALSAPVLRGTFTRGFEAIYLLICAARGFARGAS